jgi:TetR/AcrR family transcriptional regulator, transcriptional repressor for nem operon
MTTVAQRPRRDLGTATRILDTAEALVQVRGFNGFSYADIAADLQITKAALHYHFAGKADLGEALIVRYASRFGEALAAIDADGGPALRKLAGYADVYLRVLSEDRMCLCGMLAAEYQTLPQTMRDAVTGFFDANEAWLEKVLEQGRQDGSLQFAGDPRGAARMIVSGLEGASLLARAYGDNDRFRAAAERLLTGFAPSQSRAAR